MKYLLVSFFAVVIIGIFAGYNYFSFKSFKNNEISFSYPKQLNVVDDSGLVTVTGPNNFLFEIQKIDDKSTYNITTAAEYRTADEDDFYQKEKIRCKGKEGKCFPIIPGFTLHLVSESTVFSEFGIDAVEIHCYGPSCQKPFVREFLVGGNKSIYLVNFSVSEKNLRIADLIFKSLQLN